MLARRRLVCLFLNILLLRVNYASDDSHSHLLRTPDTDGDFSDCLFSDQFKQGPFTEPIEARHLQDLRNLDPSATQDTSSVKLAARVDSITGHYVSF